VGTFISGTMTPQRCSFMLKNRRPTPGLRPALVGPRRRTHCCRPKRDVRGRLSIVVVVLAVLACAPTASARAESAVDRADRNLSSLSVPWRKAVSRQYHGRYRHSAIPVRQARPAAVSEPASSGRRSVTSDEASPGSRGDYRTTGRHPAISLERNSAVSSTLPNSTDGAPSHLPSSRRFRHAIDSSIDAGTARYSRADILGSPAGPSRPATREVTASAAPGAAEIARELQKTKLMLRIGSALGLAYLGFLFLWFWATRVRPNHERGAGV
jgi:hypothetical protein